MRRKLRKARRDKFGRNLSPKRDPYRINDVLYNGTHKLEDFGGNLIWWTWNVMNLKMYYKDVTF